MFSLIVTIISIALVALLAVATIYYGGSAFAQSSSGAKAAQIINEGQQITGATDLYTVDTSGTPADLTALVGGGYLSSAPAGWTMIEGYAAKTSDDSVVCLAANQKLGVNLIPTYAEFTSNPAYVGLALCVSY